MELPRDSRADDISPKTSHWHSVGTFHYKLSQTQTHRLDQNPGITDQINTLHILDKYIGPNNHDQIRLWNIWSHHHKSHQRFM